MVVRLIQYVWPFDYRQAYLIFWVIFKCIWLHCWFFDQLAFGLILLHAYNPSHRSMTCLQVAPANECIGTRQPCNEILIICVKQQITAVSAGKGRLWHAKFFNNVIIKRVRQRLTDMGTSWKMPTSQMRCSFSSSSPHTRIDVLSISRSDGGPTVVKCIHFRGCTISKVSHFNSGDS